MEPVRTIQSTPRPRTCTVTADQPQYPGLPDVINGNGLTILSLASANKPVNFNLINFAGLRQAVLKDLSTGEVIPLQTRSGTADPQDFGSSDNPIFSPDGTKVAFESTAQLDPAYPGGSWNIWNFSVLRSNFAAPAWNISPSQRLPCGSDSRSSAPVGQPSRCSGTW